jgi:hypothetical protein
MDRSSGFPILTSALSEIYKNSGAVSGGVAAVGVVYGVHGLRTLTKAEGLGLTKFELLSGVGKHKEAAQSLGAQFPKLMCLGDAEVAALVHTLQEAELATLSGGESQVKEMAEHMRVMKMATLCRRALSQEQLTGGLKRSTKGDKSAKSGYTYTTPRRPPPKTSKYRVDPRLGHWWASGGAKGLVAARDLVPTSPEGPYVVKMRSPRTVYLNEEPTKDWGSVREQTPLLAAAPDDYALYFTDASTEGRPLGYVYDAAFKKAEPSDWYRMTHAGGRNANVRFNRWTGGFYPIRVIKAGDALMFDYGESGSAGHGSEAQCVVS